MYGVNVQVRIGLWQSIAEGCKITPLGARVLQSPLAGALK